MLSFFNEETAPVMQKLEAYLGEKFHNTNKKTGVLDGGCCHTFKESIRVNHPGNNVKINIRSLTKQIDKY